MHKQLISYLHLLKNIPKEDENIISSHFEQKTFKEGEVLFKEGKICRELFFVYEGVIRIVSVNEKGIELTHFFCKENQFCTILQSFTDETPATAGIHAACDAKVLVITKSRLLNLYQQLPYMKEIIDELNQLRLIEKVNIRNTFLGEDAEGKYRLFVVQNPDIALRVPLREIASYLGITPQSLSRIRKNIR